MIYVGKYVVVVLHFAMPLSCALKHSESYVLFVVLIAISEAVIEKLLELNNDYDYDSESAKLRRMPVKF